MKYYEMNESERKASGPWLEELEAATVAIGPHRAEGVDWPQVEPLHLASVWRMESPEVADEALRGSSARYVYRRDGHPNDRLLSEHLASLHSGEGCILTAQGMSAIAATALTVLSPGRSVWIANELYGKSHRLFRNDLARWGLECQVFDPSNPLDLGRLATARPALVLIETLSNPRLRVPNIESIADLAHANGALLLVDNTFASHLLCQPLRQGADLVMESLSKIVCGHSDSMLGMVCGRDSKLIASIAATVSTFGMASSPLDCYLSHRGLATLGLRVTRGCETALLLAKALSDCGSVALVDYPGLPSHPQHELASQQLCGVYGWMLTFHLSGTKVEVDSVIYRLSKSIPFCPSLGDVQTTISHPASTSHRGLSTQEREQLGITYGTVRVSCGSEPSTWVVEQFMNAINALITR